MSTAGLRGAIGRTAVGKRLRRSMFPGSGQYWENRYATGGTSGSGSYGPQAEWKAGVINGWVAEHAVTSVVDWGCGDGNQLSLAIYPRYLGLDRSASAVKRCIERFADDPSKSFFAFDPATTADPAGFLRADLALSLEVLFHLVEDDVREDYLRRLFASADRYVVICAADHSDVPRGPHEWHRPFSPWVREHAPEWSLLQHVQAPPDIDIVSDLYLYGRADG